MWCIKSLKAEFNAIGKNYNKKKSWNDVENYKIWNSGTSGNKGLRVGQGLRSAMPPSPYPHLYMKSSIQILCYFSNIFIASLVLNTVRTRGRQSNKVLSRLFVVSGISRREGLQLSWFGHEGLFCRTTKSLFLRPCNLINVSSFIDHSRVILVELASLHLSIFW